MKEQTPQQKEFERRAKRFLREALDIGTVRMTERETFQDLSESERAYMLEEIKRLEKLMRKPVRL